MPLTCCHAAALPGGDRDSSQTRVPVAMSFSSAAANAPSPATVPVARAPLTPRSAATRLTVVLQL
jgi:hypothetical protein